MLSLLNTVVAPAAATAQPPGLGSRADGAADAAGEFARALERSNSSWRNAPAEQPSARPAAAMPKRPDASTLPTAATSAPAPAGSAAPSSASTPASAPVAPDHRPVSRPDSTASTRTEQSGAASSAAEEGKTQSAAQDASREAGPAADNALPHGPGHTRGSQRRTVGDIRQATPAQRQRSESRRADVDDAADSSKPTGSVEDSTADAPAQGLGLAAGLLQGPPAVTESVPSSLVTPSTLMPGPEVPALSLTTDAGRAEPDADALLANVGLQPNGGATAGSVSTTSLASSMRRHARMDNPMQARMASDHLAGSAASDAPGTTDSATARTTAATTANTTPSAAANAAGDTEPGSTAAWARSMNATDRDSISVRTAAADAASHGQGLHIGMADKRNARPLAPDASDDPDKTGPAVAGAFGTGQLVLPTADAAQAGAAAQLALADASRAGAAHSADSISGNTSIGSQVGGNTARDAAAVGADRRAGLSAFATSSPSADPVTAADGPARADDGRTALATTAVDTSRIPAAISDSLASPPGAALARPADDSRGAPNLRATRIAAAGSNADVANSALQSAGDTRARPAAPASGRATDNRASDGRPARGDTDASAQAAASALNGTHNLARDTSGSGSHGRPDSQRDNTAALNATTGNLGTSTPSGSDAPRFGDQLQSGLPTGAVAAPAQPAAAAVASLPSTPVVSSQLSPSLYSPDFAPAMGAQVTLFARNGVHQARIELNPAEMGPISVQIEMKGSGARVDFQAEQAGTRQVIESSLPALASALRDAGMTLTGGSVFQPDATQAGAQANPGFGPGTGGADNGQPGHAGHNPAGNHAGGQRGGGRGSSADDGANFGSSTSTVRLANAQRGLVDLIA